jgi:hypothetical protein
MADKSELRKHPRKHYGRPAWIDVGDGSPRLCMVYDLSETGVGIRLATDETPPAQFTLLFTRTGRPSRRCRVLWQDGHRIGCEFVDRVLLNKRKLSA